MKPMRHDETLTKQERLGRFGERVISACTQAGRMRVIGATAIAVILVAFLDWLVGATVSLAALYIIPMMLGAIVLHTGETAVLALICALLQAKFDLPASPNDAALRFVFAFLAFLCSALFVMALVHNRQLAVEHIRDMEREQALRREAEEQLQILVESSPAGILTLNAEGIVLAANNAANGLFAVGAGENLRGQQISAYLHVLSDALRFPKELGEFRTAAQCQGRRSTGEIFLANTWFSSYTTRKGTHLAAIIVDASEEMRDREEQSLRELLTYNRIAATAISHEVRNVCGAVSLLSRNLGNRKELAGDNDFQTLIALVGGLEKIASFQLHSQSQKTLESVSLQEVLDSLRIIVDAEWREIGGTIQWPIMTALPQIFADPHGLLQALLNLVQNSRRAVQVSSIRKLTITVSTAQDKVAIRLKDSGPGISSPELLFQPFHSGGEGTGLGLYISRALVRGYGGDLRLENGGGSCFLVELQVAS
jgi:C4-dicarboxylate-specific signal transduction histidine kinase